MVNPALAATTKDIVDGLADGGYINGSNMELKVESAQGNMALSGQIANKFVSNEPGYSSRSCNNGSSIFCKICKAGKTKLIFTTVTDPIGVNLVKNLDQPGNNISGEANCCNYSVST